MIFVVFDNISARADNTTGLYPYTIFAASNEEGAISINADNFCVNGNVTSNGSILSTGSVNINGTRSENVNEKMIFIFNKIDTTYFSGSNVEIHDEDYFLEDLNININTPLEVEGDTSLTGNINIDTVLKAFGDILLQGEVKNTDNSIIFSKYGNIVIDSQNVNLNGLVYAPFGEVIITAQNLTLNNVVIIANKVTINCPSVNANYSSNMAGFVGITSEKLNIPYDEWENMDDNNENGLPDFFEDVANWHLFEDTDGDLLPDVIEIWLGSDSNMQDSDGDGLDDFYEMSISLTDLTLTDTDNNGIPDGDEDLDLDNLTNLEEYQLGTHPLYVDSDGDGLSDYDEIYLYFTNPNEKDTDDDGANDQWESENGFDPNVYNKSFDISSQAEGKNISASVSMEVLGSQVESLSVEPADDLLFNDTVPGYIGSPFRFEIDGTFEQANISFAFDSRYLNDEKFLPTIYYYNVETQLLEELPTTVDGNVASTVTTHFSIYVLLNKTTYEEAWHTIKAPDKNSNVSKINIAFVVDTSGSMRGNKIVTAKNVIRNFINKIRKNNVETNVALVNFSSSANIIYGLSNDYDVFLESLNGLNPNGLTAIYTGLDKALQALNAYAVKYNEYDAIIILTDGYDEPATTYNMYEQYVIKAINSQTDIYTIGVGTIDEALLIRLADEIGGKYFFADDAAQLYDIYEEIHSEIIDYTTDSNYDGISDYYTKCLCNGTLRIGTQCNIFKGISYEEFNANNDYDGDGIINGDEFEIIHDETTGRVYVRLHSNPVESDSDFDGMDDAIDDKPLDSSVGFLIYETEDSDEKLKSLSISERPEDYQYADKSIDEMRTMKYISWGDFLGVEIEDYVNSWKSLVRLTSKGDMDPVAIDMVNHFMDGTGTDYSNNILTQNIEKHKNTVVYENQITQIVNSYIETNNGDISGLSYHEDKRDDSPMVREMKNNLVYQPVYPDKTSGLGICVDGLYGNSIEIASYKFDGKNYEYILRFTLYDIYGLDSADVEEAKYLDNIVGFGILAGFRSWYIIQHCNLYGGDYQPYISYMIFEKTISGGIE
ncbi:MAG: VWA domain-containing protein [Clostridium sp.]|nr:VWA domain-containing protein [Clostridium sp.]